VLVVAVKEPLVRLAPGSPLGGDPLSAISLLPPSLGRDPLSATSLLPPPPQAAKAKLSGDIANTFVLTVFLLVTNWFILHSTMAALRFEFKKGTIRVVVIVYYMTND
jgi:hypothetical protein